MLYAGLNNRDSFLTSNFEVNFLPAVDIRAKTTVRTLRENLFFKEFNFAANDEKEIRRPAIFEPGETVYLIFNVEGYKVQSTRVWLQEDIAIGYPDGSIGLKVENINDLNRKVSSLDPILFENNIALPDDAMPGRYSVTLTLRDKLANKEISEQRFFYVTTKKNDKKRALNNNQVPEKSRDKNNPIKTNTSNDNGQKKVRRSFD